MSSCFTHSKLVYEMAKSSLLVFRMCILEAILELKVTFLHRLLFSSAVGLSGGSLKGIPNEMVVIVIVAQG